MVRVVPVLAVTLTLAACDGAGAESPQSDHPLYPWVCVSQPLERVAIDGRAQATVGQPTDAAAQARRLYEAEKWDSAIVALAPVVRGATGDDEGNRQLAEYMLAKALFRAGRFVDCVARFRAIARVPDHAKHGETLLWIAKLAQQPETRGLVDPSDLQTYTDADASRFDNPQQRDTYYDIAYFLGVQRYRSGKRADAAALFHAVGPGSRYHAEAARCAILANGGVP